MNEKKQQILKSAMKLFAENGFHSTSMQGIADQIGIGKGTLYIHFKSKEQLLLSILEQYQNDLFEKIEFVSSDRSLSEKEVLIKQVYVQLSEFQKNSDFIKMQFKEQLNHDSEAVKEFIMYRKARILNWIKKGLLAVYGEKITPYLWDLVILFNGIIREYMLLLVFEKKPIDIETAADFLVNRLDGITAEILSVKPHNVITAEMMSDVERIDSEKSFQTQEEIISNELIKIALTIKRLNAAEDKKEELFEAVHELQEELNKDKPRTFMMKALISFLESDSELGKEMKQLKDLLYLKFDLRD